jgi:predicted Zn-dependent protease
MRSTAKHTRWVLVLALAAVAWAQQRQLRPGFNLFSKEQDIQMGKEYAAQVEQQMHIVRNAELSAFVESIGRKLASAPDAGGYPYTFKVVQDKTINAFALPGGPTFTHTGLIAAADNEAQIAGVLAHEIAHVALRHGTNQASKAQLLALPLMLAGGLAGDGITGQLAQLGIGLGANSVLMKFSRNAERDADLLGARIMSHAGYNPIEMARFFEKLEAETGKGSALSQFFSDHPNPGNRVKSVQDEIRYLPRRSYNADTGKLPQVKRTIQSLPAVAPARLPGTQQQADPQAIPSARPSSRLKEYQSREAVFAHPENWQVLHVEDNSVTIAPKAGVVGASIGYGMIANVYDVSNRNASFEQRNQEMLQSLAQDNPGMRAASSPRRVTVNGSRAILSRMESPSPYQGAKEVDTVVAFERPGGALFYLVLIAPDRDYNNAQRVFEQVIQSVRFPN